MHDTGLPTEFDVFNGDCHWAGLRAAEEVDVKGESVWLVLLFECCREVFLHGSLNKDQYKQTRG